MLHETLDHSQNKITTETLDNVNFRFKSKNIDHKIRYQFHLDLRISYFIIITQNLRFDFYNFFL